MLFALPFVYNYPFLFGFANFALSMALALNLFALWLRLARLGRLRYRAALFAPLSVILWVVHAFGWGTLGVLAFSAELVRQYDRGCNIFRPLPLGLQPGTDPDVAYPDMRSESAAPRGWFNWQRKGEG